MVGTLTVQNLQGPTSGANANKVIIPSGQTLDASNGFVAPAGSVLQVVTNEAGISSFNSTSWTTVVSTSITPKSSTSKIYVSVSCPGYGGAEAKVKGNARILRGTDTQIQYLRSFWYREATGHIKASSSSMVKLDTPSTTNSITYYAQVRIEAGTNNLHLTEADNGEWVITLMEIAG
jgi:hypothetical protein